MRRNPWWFFQSYPMSQKRLLVADVRFEGDLMLMRVRVWPYMVEVWRGAIEIQLWVSYELEERCEMVKGILARLAVSSPAKQRAKAAPEKEATERFPNITELLSVTVLPGGEERLPSKITLMWEDGAWKAGITEPGMEASAWVTTFTLEGLLDALEARLASDDPDVWRKWASAFKGQRKGAKKG